MGDIAAAALLALGLAGGAAAVASSLPALGAVACVPAAGPDAAAVLAGADHRLSDGIPTYYIHEQASATAAAPVTVQARRAPVRGPRLAAAPTVCKTGL